MSTKNLLIQQTQLAFSEDPEMSLMVSIKGVTADSAAKRLTIVSGRSMRLCCLLEN
jgi:hypothetical protein